MTDLPSDQIIVRAAELWSRAIVDGQWDNGDTSLPGVMVKTLVTQNRGHAIDTTGLEIQKLAKQFRAAFIEVVIAMRDAVRDGRESFFRGHCRCDYSPDATLVEVCTKAAVDPILLPCKSDTWLYSGHVHVRFGYGDRSMNHYPLGDGRWLVTSLAGNDDNDMAPIIQAVLEGRLPELTVEQA